MTNKQKYKRLSWFLLGGTMSLFAGGMTIPSLDYYARHYEWFLWVYFLCILTMGLAALFCFYEYEAEKNRERINKEKQELESFKKEVGKLSDSELIKKHVDTPYGYDKFKILAQEICYRWRKSLDKPSV